MNWIELGGAVLSALGVWLVAKRRPLGWPVSLASVVVYAWIFFEARLYSDVLLQGAFAVMIVYGWSRWVRHLDSGGQVRVVALAARPAALHLLLGAAGALALGYTMSHWTNAAVPWLDAALTAFSLVAQWWQARRHAAAWWAWIAVDVVYVGVFLYKDLHITAILYAGFVVLAVIGLRKWRRALHARTAPG